MMQRQPQGNAGASQADAAEADTAMNGYDAALRLRDERIAELQTALDGAVTHMREGAQLLQDMAASAQAFDRIVAELCSQQLPAASLVRFGEIFYGINALEDAERLFLRALDADPGDIDALNNLGVLHYGRGDIVEAERYFYAALERDPRRRESRDNLHSLYTAHPELFAQPRADGVTCPCCGAHLPKFIPGGVNLRPTRCVRAAGRWNGTG